MFATREERLREIETWVREQGSISVRELQARLEVSAATIRNDIRFLAQAGRIQRTHGRVEAMGEYGAAFSLPKFVERMRFRHAEKAAIARVAEAILHDNEAIFLDASSTCYHLARLLAGGKKRLTVVTNGLYAAQELNVNPLIRVVLVGGTMGVQNNTEGSLGADLLQKLHLHKALLSGYGVSLERGATDFSLYEIELKQLVIKASEELILLVDSSKFGVNSVGSFCSVADARIILTDDGLDPAVRERFSKLGPQVITATIRRGHGEVEEGSGRAPLDGEVLLAPGGG